MSRRKHSIPRARKDAVLDRDNWTCTYCGKPLSRATVPCEFRPGTCTVPEGYAFATVDHVIPFSKGGKHGMDNLVACCPSCNSRKQAKSLEEWKA